jgi:hypothetical protein
MRPWRVAHVEQRRYVHSASDWLGSERYERLRLGLLSAQEVGHLQGAPGAAQTRKLLELKAGHSAAAAANEMASVEIHWAQVRLPDPVRASALPTRAHATEEWDLWLIVAASRAHMLIQQRRLPRRLMCPLFRPFPLCLG